MHRFLIALALASFMPATQSQAQTLLLGTHSIGGNLCAGSECGLVETFPNFSTMKLNEFDTRIYFEDTSTAVGFPTNDWRLEANGPSSMSGDYFAIIDHETDAKILRLDAGAPSNSLYVSASSNVGVGTSLPNASVHVVRPTLATMRLETTGGSPARWEMSSSALGFLIQDVENSTIPFRLESGAPTNALNIDDSGQVGLGLLEPEGKLHTKGDGVQLSYFESGDGGAVQVRFRTDSENRRFLAVDNADNVKTQMQFRDDAILFLGQTIAQEWLRVDASGITTAGPTCGSPCDLTFDPEVFTVPPIAERAAYMWENKHLPAVGPTGPDQPVNLTEKMGGMLHELEIAHIYIEELHGRLEAQETRQAELQTENADLRQRLARLEEVVLAD